MQDTLIHDGIISLAQQTKSRSSNPFCRNLDVEKKLIIILKK